ncbi:hypothetical protein GCK32_018602 [Trichostrongylus colubriformis]|uniref:Uncharacterized protein n=1 Tax=Trichostrongylus colubriformis TaxID=6319 RepID=A0AAN8FW90_TRICO
MTTASRFHIATSPVMTKFCETRPSPTMRRNEKIRALARSVQEITESEEEDDSQVSSPQPSARSPFALVESPFVQRRSTSLSSPITTRHFTSKRLARGLSDPCIRRPSFGSQPLSPKIEEETLALPPIPEAATPGTPVMPNKEMEEDNENNDLDSSQNT